MAFALVMLAVGFPAAAQPPCDAPDADRWVRDIYGWMTSYDELGVYAIQRYGPPVGCTGETTAAFDGVDFGWLRLAFDGGATFEIQTFPPESSVTALTDSSGFGDKASIQNLLERYTADIGVSIDWTSPLIETAENRRVVTYWDPDDGLNASARLVFVDSVLVSVSVSLAL